MNDHDLDVTGQTTLFICVEEMYVLIQKFGQPSKSENKNIKTHINTSNSRVRIFMELGKPHTVNVCLLVNSQPCKSQERRQVQDPSGAAAQAR